MGGAGSAGPFALMVTLTGTFTYSNATPLDGYAELDMMRGVQFLLIGSAVLLGTSTQVPVRYVATIRAGAIVSVAGTDGFTSTNQIWGNDEVSPLSTHYKYSLRDTAGNLLAQPQHIPINSGAFDLVTGTFTVPTITEIQASTTVTPTKPVAGCHRVTNLYVTPDLKLYVEYDTNS